jgi:hypothetical protein
MLCSNQRFRHVPSINLGRQVVDDEAAIQPLHALRQRWIQSEFEPPLVFAWSESVCHMAAPNGAWRRKKHLVFADYGALVPNCMRATVGHRCAPVYAPFAFEFDLDAADIHVVGAVEDDSSGELDGLRFLAFAIEDCERRIQPAFLFSLLDKGTVQLCGSTQCSWLQCNLRASRLQKNRSSTGKTPTAVHDPATMWGKG